MGMVKATQTPVVVTITAADIVTVAVGYAKRGWPVFPIHTVQNAHCSCGKQDCPHPGKHPATRHGFKDATRNGRVIRGWWSRIPYNVGVSTGVGSGIIVVDVDPRNGGDASVDKLIHAHGHLPDTLKCKTGGGGWHLYFKHPGPSLPSRSFADGLEVKADGAYVIAPPSLHQSGKRYTWVNVAALALLPKWLESLVRISSSRTARRTARQALLSTAERVGVAEGLRNSTLARLAGRWFTQGFGEEQATAKAMDFASRCTPPLPLDETVKVVKKIYALATGRRSTEQRAMLLVRGHRLSSNHRQVLLGLFWLWRDLGRPSLVFDAPYRMIARYSGVSLKSIRACLAALEHHSLIRLQTPQRRAIEGRVFYPTRLTFVNAVASLLEEEL